MAKDSPAKEVEEKGTSGSPRPKKVKKILILFGGFILFMGFGIGAIIFFAPDILPEGLKILRSKEAKKPSKEMKGHLYMLDAFIVNLANPDRSKYLKVKMEMEGEESKPNEEFDKRQPQIRDAVLLILTGKTSKEISDSEGKNKLKEEILLKVNQLLNGPKIKAIYFTEFVVQ